MPSEYPKPSILEYTEAQGGLIEKTRQSFLGACANEPQLYYPEDLDLVRRDVWWTLRFLKWNSWDEEKALKQMTNAFQWRKSFGVLDRQFKDLPIEFSKSGAVFPLGRDRKGHHVLYVRAKVNRRIDKLYVYFQQFLTGVVDHVDKEAGPYGIALVFDMSQVGLTNVDLDFLKFFTQLSSVYYPCGIRYVLCHNFPKIVKPFWNASKGFMGRLQDSLRLTNGVDELEKYIERDQIPRYLGGTNGTNFTNLEIMRQGPSVLEVCEGYGIAKDEALKYLKIFQTSMEEAEKLAKGC